MATDGRLNDLFDELRAGGEVDSRGSFTLDRAQARAKMQKFQLADARRYVLELVQAAVLRGATRIAFDIDADDMRMRFDGRPFTPAELDDLWGSIFADGDGADLRGVRQLALGLNAALGLKPRRIVVRSGSQQVVLAPGRDDAWTAIDAPVAETTIHVAQRLHLGLVVAFFRDLRGSLGEEVHLRERCRYARVAITLDGVAIAGGPKIERALVVDDLAEPGVEGAIGLVEHEPAAEVRLVKDGVWIDTHPLEGCGPGLVAIVEAEALRKDVSMAKIVADHGFEQVAGLIRAARWGLYARLVEAAEQGRLKTEQALPRARREVLQFLKLRDLRKRAEVAPLARAITWMDARTCPGGQAMQVSLAALVEAVVTDPDSGVRELPYAIRSYPELKAEGPPIPRIGRDQAGDLARLLSCNMVAVDDGLEAAQKREKARLEWQKRPVLPRLADFGRYLLRTPLAGPGIDGELGIASEAVDGGRQDGRIWLIAQGCLLRQVDVDLGVPGLELAVAAEFTPSALFDDAARDARLVEVVLRTLAALPGPLVDLAERTAGSRIEAGVRGVVKGWLLLAVDADARAGLWARLRVPEALWPAPDEVGRWLPTSEQLRSGAGPWARLRQVPLFEDFDGARRSLDELARRLAQVGRLEEVDRSEESEPGLGREIVRLGRGDRKILAGLLGGEAVLQSWAPTLAQQRRGRRFRAQPQRSIVEAAEARVAELRAAGLDPGLWSRVWASDGVEAVMILRPPAGTRGPVKEGAPASIELRFEGRPLATRTLDLGFAPITAVASAKTLKPNASWDDVADDEAMAAVTAGLQRAVWSLVAGVVRRWMTGSGVDDATWTWLRSQLLLRLTQCTREEVIREAQVLLQVPLFATLGRRVLSLEEVDAVVAAEGHIAWVPMTTPGATLPDPPIVREEAPAIAALRHWVGESRLIDGRERLRARRLERRLADLPTVTSLTLDPAAVWTTTSLAGDNAKVEGEVGLQRGRSDAALRIDICMDGRKIGDFVHEDAGAPLLAIACDPELPLTIDGEVDARSKRYGQLLRRCRRAAHGLVAQLCERHASLPDEEREAARVLLLEYAARRIDRAKRDGSEPGRGVEAVRTLPLLVDVWGRRCSLVDVEGRKGGAIEVVTQSVAAPPDTMAAGRMILVVDPPARRCLEAIGEVTAIDHRWAEVVAGMRARIASPPCEVPDLRRVAWVDRKATIAGGLQAHLWIPRTPTKDDTVALAHEGREIGRMMALAALPCAGIVSGEGLTSASILDARQRSSLVKQVCRLYETLAKQVNSGGRMNASERDAAAEWLAYVDGELAACEDPVLGELGKALTQLQAALAELVPPALRQARASAAQTEARKRAEAQKAAEAQLAGETAEPAATAVRAAAAPVEVVATPAAEPLPAPTPEQQLLALVRAELEWARARHGSTLERLRLDRLAIGTGREPGIARFDQGIVLQARHSLIARALTRLAIGEAPDPVDMVFVMANVYTVMNEVAEEIGADDEQAFVARLSEGLAAGLARV
ncbi:hypothetical protein [Nannocystis radixulma]|uniref:Uncharacterized protein n=1 Tax=Nannocystis radixulma TaxID=2995305 RepID=A0ABT5B156_9BACT|nr:hypothetical protein [Nannocystis radixulma]MDC0667839.1 hypothetical protein [Nannocystis radixulma]